MTLALRRGIALAAAACSLLVALAAPAVAWADDPPAARLRPLEGTEAPPIEPAPDLSPFVGRPISRVEIRSRGSWGAGAVRSPGALRAGDPFDVEQARLALRELLDAGRVADASLSVVADGDGDGVAVIVEVVPALVVRTTRLEGGVLDTAETMRSAGVRGDMLLTEAGLARTREAVRAFYEARGFHGTRVGARTTPASEPGEVDLLLEVEPGEVRLVDLRVFVIEPEVDAELRGLQRQYAVETGDRADEDALELADRDLADLLRERGFFRAEVSHRVKPVGDVAHLYVRVDAGPRVEPIFEGARAFDPDQLREALSEGGAAWGSEEELTERLRAFYVRRGFLDVEVKTSRRTGRAAVEHLVFTIREGSPVRVTRRVFPCLPPEFDPDDVGEEIESFLDEELPDATLSAPDPSTIESAIGPTTGRGGRPSFDPVEVTARYAPDTYGRAVKHLNDLFASRGYLHSNIGPARVVRARCAPSSTAARCVPEPLPDLARATCAVDESGLPIPEPPLPESATCTAEPGRGVECAPEVVIRLPMQLGPQTILYDVAFDVSDPQEAGSERVSDALLSLLAGLETGVPLSNQAVEEARQRLLEAYRERGFYYADVRSDLELSPDRTRGRVRFSISPREIVRVKSIEIRGARYTDADVVRRRLVLAPGDPFKKSSVRTSEERIATLGPFSSVTIALENPEIPERDKHVIVTVAEDKPIYVEPRIGFSTGDGLRGGLEVGHRTLWGEAISLTVRTQFAYLFDFMIIDDGVRRNLEPLPKLQRLERRNSIRMVFPEIGLGPLFGLALEGIDIRDNQRDFGLTRDAFVPALLFRPSRELSAQLATSLELNDVQIFNAESVEDAIRENRALERLLRFPDGRTVAVAQRIGGAWDRRDNAFAATRGTLFTAEIEHVNAFPADDATRDTNPITSHFMRLSGRIAGYLRFSRQGLSLALTMASGGNIQLVPDSRTYPDRLFYLGGFDSHRAFLTDALIPEDVAQQILDSSVPPSQRLTVDDIGVRGGDLMLNPRAELRIPLGETFATALFVDAGNVWVDPSAVDPLALRLGAGSGLRINTPIGPLALDYGINLDRRQALDEDFGALHFSVGLF